jgi:hypothetical protein
MLFPHFEHFVSGIKTHLATQAIIFSDLNLTNSRKCPVARADLRAVRVHTFDLIFETGRRPYAHVQEEEVTYLKAHWCRQNVSNAVERPHLHYHNIYT